MKKVDILGSTGSIGTQALDIVRKNRETFKIGALSCGTNISLLVEQIFEFQPDFVSVRDEKTALELSKKLKDSEYSCLEIFFGDKGNIRVAENDGDIVLNSLMGIRGLLPTMSAIERDKDVALANKETLVAGGINVMEAVKKKGVKLLPVDSEHSAIFQCLQGNEDKRIKKIILTASGGPFRNYSFEQLKEVTVEKALQHPNWNMGKKITIDSATLMNKGLELIEAKWLFDVDEDDIEVVVHPQSIIHSAVEFEDTSILAQLGIPDMRIPISVALGYPDRLTYDGKSLSLTECTGLTFEKPDIKTFRCLKLAIDASKAGGTYPAVMNGANEFLVARFLQGNIRFTDIPYVIEKVMEAHSSKSRPSIEQVMQADIEARNLAERVVRGLTHSA